MSRRGEENEKMLKAAFAAMPNPPHVVFVHGQSANHNNANGTAGTSSAMMVDAPVEAAAMRFPSGRPVQQPRHMQDMVNPITQQPMRPRSNLTFDQIYVPPPADAVGLARHCPPANFPLFQQRMAEVHGQCELLVQVATTLMEQYQDAVDQLRRREEELTAWKSRVPVTVNALEAAALSCSSVADLLDNLMRVRETNVTQDGGTESGDEDRQQPTPALGEGPVPPVAAAMGPQALPSDANIVIPLQGRGYLGTEMIQIWRIDIRRTNSIKLSFPTSVCHFLPCGSYISLLSIVELCGVAFGDPKEDEDRKVLDGLVSDAIF